jgi:hypothetical protein
LVATDARISRLEEKTAAIASRCAALLAAQPEAAAGSARLQLTALRKPME